MCRVVEGLKEKKTRIRVDVQEGINKRRKKNVIIIIIIMGVVGGLE